MENFIPYSSFSPEEILVFQEILGSELTNANSTFLSIILFFLSIAFWTAVCGDAGGNNRTV